MPGKKASAFLAFTLVLSLGPVSIAWANGVRDIMHGGLASLLFLLSPALSAIVCAMLFDRGTRLQALGLPFSLNVWLLIALSAPFILAPIGVGAVLALSPYAFLGFAGWANQTGAEPPWLAGLPDLGIPALLVARVLSGILLAIPEELGWRGYLFAQWRGLGFWRCSWMTGLAWSIWHWPIMLCFGMNMAPGRPLASLTSFTLYTLLLAPIMTILRDRARSIWGPVVFHGTMNAVMAFVFLLWNKPAFPWDWAGLAVTAGLGAALVAFVMQLMAARQVYAAMHSVGPT